MALKFLPILALSLSLVSAARGGTVYDLILKGGTLVDGSAGPAYQADLGFKDGRLVKIGNLSGEAAGRVVDATSKMVMPGFIDILCHNDLIWSPVEQKRALERGATFGLVGNCGFSILNVQANLRKIETGQKLLLNAGTLIAHGEVRNAVMGRTKREPTPQEMERMLGMVDRALSEGAFGLSSGLGYEPGEWSKPEEVRTLAGALSRHPNASYFTHIRNFRSKVLEAIQEAVDVAEAVRVPVVVQHLLFKMPANWDLADSGLRILEGARLKGLSVYASVYPYDFWGNEVQLPLHQFLYFEASKLTWRSCSNADKRDAMLELIHRRLAEYGGGKRVEITGMGPKAPKGYLGLTLDKLARMRGLTEEELVLALLLENRQGIKICYHGISEQVLERQIQSPFTLFGSDAAKDIPHPRNVGAFPRLLSTYVRDRRAVRLTDAVARLTSEPAKLLGLKDRGMLKEGYWGDVVVLDYDLLEDRATPVNPWEPPRGVEMVLVNGQVVLEGNELTGAGPGKVLRREGK